MWNRLGFFFLLKRSVCQLCHFSIEKEKKKHSFFFGWDQPQNEWGKENLNTNRLLEEPSSLELAGDVKKEEMRAASFWDTMRPIVGAMCEKEWASETLCVRLSVVCVKNDIGEKRVLSFDHVALCERWCIEEMWALIVKTESPTAQYLSNPVYKHLWRVVSTDFQGSKGAFLVKDDRVLKGPLSRSLRLFARTAHFARSLRSQACSLTLLTPS